MAGQDLLVLVNAAAGATTDAETAAALDELSAEAGRAGARVEVVRTDGSHELEEALRGLEGRRLVVVGGDGSVHAAVQSLHDRGHLQSVGPVGIVPLGTGNDLARALELPADLTEAARTAVSGSARPVSLLVADDGVVTVNAVHVGIGVDAAMRASRLKRRLGRLAYRLGALVAGVTSRGRRLRVTVDGSVLHDGRRPVLLVALGIGDSVGGGAPLVPGADPHDDLVDVVVSTAVSRPARLAQAVQVRFGMHVERPDVRSDRGREVEVRAAPGESFHEDSDGEVRGPFTCRRWRVEPAAWQVRVQRPSRR